MNLRLPFPRRANPVVVAFRVRPEELARIDAAALALYREKTPYYERDNRSPRGWYLRAVVLAAVELNESREARVAAEVKGPAAAGKPDQVVAPSRPGKPAEARAIVRPGKPARRGKPRKGSK